jgi:two-component system, NarL family, response regulator YdfI
MMRVLVVASSPSSRRGLAQVLEDAGIEVTVAAGAAAASLDAVIEQRHPDVVLLEAGAESHAALPVGLEQTPAQDGTPVVVLVDELESEAAAAALRAGARAALPRDATATEIVAAVRAAAAGLAALPAELAASVFRLKAGDGTPAPGDATVPGGRSLTPREAEILTLLGDGLGNKAIARQLGISDHTVKTHLASIYEKLGAANRAEAVATGLRRGLILL